MILRKFFIAGFAFALAFGLILWHESQPEVHTADAAGATIWGDVNCSGGVDGLDVVVLLRNAASLPVDQQDGCPGIGTTIAAIQSASQSHLWGDNDCSGAPNIVDALQTLLKIADLPVSQSGGCPQIGASMATEPSRKVILYITGIASVGNCSTPRWVGLGNKPGWSWITNPLKEAVGTDNSDFIEYIYRDDKDDSPTCKSLDDSYEFDRHDSCWSLDDSIDPDIGSALNDPPIGSGPPRGQAGKLKDFIKKYLQDNDGVELSIVAHSQGGVLAAYTLAYYHGDPDIAKVTNLITLDSPLQGIRNIAGTALGISQARGWFGCHGKDEGNESDDKRYDSIWDMLPWSPAISDITYPGNLTCPHSLYHA